MSVLPLSRTGWLAVLAGMALVTGLAVRLGWPSTRPALDCAPADVRFEGGVATCRPGAPQAKAPAGAALTVGVKLDLNRATADELGVIPGIGPALALAIVKARDARGPFKSWDDVDAVPGVGPAKLEALMAASEFR